LKKRLVILLVALLLPALLAAAEQAPRLPDVSGYTVEELLLLQERIQAELLSKGHNPYYDLERGDKGDAVLNIQKKLQELGYYDGPLNGKLDSETQKAFKRFEKDHGLANDGLPSGEDQAVLFSVAAGIEPADEIEPAAELEPADEIEPTAELEPAGEIEPAAELEPADEIEPSAELEEAETAGQQTDPYQEYGPLDYQDCLQHPEKHDGEKVVLRGQVLQVLGNKNEGFQIRLATAGDKDVVYVTINYAPDFDLAEDVNLVVYARMKKTFTYESTWGFKITIPAAEADHIILE
jgi:peptidoglycan hydrolase-like protein with peptidoglycan-binding domain